MYWSYVLGALGIFGIFLTTKKLRQGFYIGLFAQVLWAIYAVATSQYGFLLTAAGYAAVNILGIHRWSQPEEKDKV